MSAEGLQPARFRRTAAGGDHLRYRQLELDGGLRRSNLLLALRSLDLDHPQPVDGVRFETRGFDDAFPIEGSRVGRFDVSRRGWVNEAEVIDVNGGTPDCFWGDDGC